MTRYKDGRPRCEAVTGTRYDDYGQPHPVRCHQVIGLRAFEAADGTHHYCAKHEAAVRARVARLVA